MGTRRIPVQSLKVGMYVTGIDRSWLRTPWFRHRFEIADPSEIEALKECGVQEVTIDPDKGLDVESSDFDQSSSSDDAARIDTEPVVEAPSGGQGSPPQAQQLAENLSVARQKLGGWSGKLKSLFDSAESQGFVPVEGAKQVVQEMIGDMAGRESACLAILRTRQGNPAVYEHALSVCTLSLVLAQAMGYAQSELQRVGLGALLHDVGILRLPQNLLRNRHSLAPAQRALYEKHPDHGLEMVKKSGPLDPLVGCIVEQHHSASPEQTSANGQDTGLPEGCRLVMIADAYDELVTGQGDFPAMSSHQAVSQLYQLYQDQPLFSDLAALLIRVIGVYPLYSVVQLKSQEVGIVTAITPGQAHRPVLCLALNSQGQPYDPLLTLDLNSDGDPNHMVEAMRNEHDVGLDIEALLKQVGV